VLTPNQQIGRYQIISAIGAGGMGEVYLAKDSELERSVALKILPEEVANDNERIQRFRQEAKVVSALNHPNILTIHEIGSEEGTRFIASEFVKGHTLREKMQVERFTLDAALEIAIQVASALDTAHSANVIHRDIKPENIMIRDDGLVKVLDFGLAKLLNESSDATLLDTQTPTKAMVKTQLGIVLGTVFYMSPEQTRGIRPLDGRSDIWSLGVILFEMLSGQRPFTGETPNDVIANILKTDAPIISTLIPNSSPELDRILIKTLKKDRNERYQNVKDLALDLKNLKKEMEFSARFFQHSNPASEQLTVRYDSSHTDSTMLPAMTDRIISKGSSKSKFISGLLASLVIVVGTSFYYVKSGFYSSPVQNSAQLKTSEVASWSSSSGEIYSVGSFSPDGKMIAFVSRKDGNPNIWIKQTSSGEAIQVTKDEFPKIDPIWSPNGEELAFFSSRQNQNGFWRIPILGGSPKFISTLDNASSNLRFWSKENLLYYELEHEVYTSDVNSGISKKITNFAENGIAASSISVSLDEKRVAYVTTEDEIVSLWISNIDGTSAKKLSTGSSQIKNSAWHPDNQRIFFSSIVDGTFQIFVTDVNGSEPRQVTFGESDSLILTVSSDGTKVLFGSAKEESDIWSVNLTDGKESNVASDIDSELWADVSPDGKRLAYQTIKNLSQGNNISGGRILTLELNAGRQPVELVSNGWLPKWSPDGNRLAYLQLSGQKYRLQTIAATGGEQKALTSDEFISVSYSVLPYHRIESSDFSWSPDSKKIAYVSTRNQQSQAWIANLDGSGTSPISAPGESNLNFSCPLWSPDGKQIAISTKFGNPDGTTTYGIVLSEVATNSSNVLLKQNSFLRLMAWSLNGSELIVSGVENFGYENLHPVVTLYRIDVKTSTVTEFAKLEDSYLFNSFLSPDGKTIAFTARRDGNDNLWLISASGGKARKITNNNDARLYFSSLAWSPDSKKIFFGKQSRYSLLSMLSNFQ